MRTLALCVLAGVVLSACQAEKREYEMSVAEATSKLLAARFKKGILPGSSSLEPRVLQHSARGLEWIVADDFEGPDGWICPLSIEPAGEDGKKVQVTNKCEGPFARGNNEQLDELVDATLTGRPVKFD